MKLFKQLHETDKEKNIFAFICAVLTNGKCLPFNHEATLVITYQRNGIYIIKSCNQLGDSLPK